LLALKLCSGGYISVKCSYVELNDFSVTELRFCVAA
jgi:hypothetical protein